MGRRIRTRLVRGRQRGLFHGGDTSVGSPELLAVSDRFIGPLFRAVIDRATAGGTVPRLVEEWNRLSGWADAGGAVEAPAADARDLLSALVGLAAADLAPHCAETATTPAECLRCAAAIRAFVGSALARGARVFVEDR